jgi:hypothetical protein
MFNKIQSSKSWMYLRFVPLGSSLSRRLRSLTFQSSRPLRLPDALSLSRDRECDRESRRRRVSGLSDCWPLPSVRLSGSVRELCFPFLPGLSLLRPFFG